MKRSLIIVLFHLLTSWHSFAAGEPRWQYGRIESVKKSVTTTTKAWVVNTPLDEESTRYTISVHVQDRIVVGNYEVSSTQLDPRQNGRLAPSIMLQVSSDVLYLRSGTDDLRLKITQRKTAGPMKPITAEEKKALSALDTPPESLIGPMKSDEGKGPASSAPRSSTTTTSRSCDGMVMVRSTPYLSEVFVDGDYGIYAGKDRAWSRETQLSRGEARLYGLDEGHDDYSGIRADAGRHSAAKINRAIAGPLGAP